MRICSWCGVGISWWRFRLNGRCRECRLDLSSPPYHYMRHLPDVAMAHHATVVAGGCHLSGAVQNCIPTETSLVANYDTPPSLDPDAVDVWLDR